MSHASHDLMRDLVKRIRAVEKQIGRPIGILADLQGPKLRVGDFRQRFGRTEPGQTFTLDIATSRATTRGSICRIPKSSKPFSPATAC
jgi:pyruvate kinase